MMNQKLKVRITTSILITFVTAIASTPIVFYNLNKEKVSMPEIKRINRNTTDPGRD